LIIILLIVTTFLCLLLGEFLQKLDSLGLHFDLESHPYFVRLILGFSCLIIIYGSTKLGFMIPEYVADFFGLSYRGGVTHFLLKIFKLSHAAILGGIAFFYCRTIVVVYLIVVVPFKLFVMLINFLF
jgi:hypothetical protein